MNEDFLNSSYVPDIGKALTSLMNILLSPYLLGVQAVSLLGVGLATFLCSFWFPNMQRTQSFLVREGIDFLPDFHFCSWPKGTLGHRDYFLQNFSSLPTWFSRKTISLILPSPHATKSQRNQGAKASFHVVCDIQVAIGLICLFVWGQISKVSLRFLNSHLEFLASTIHLLPHYKRLRGHHQNLATSRSHGAPESQERSRAWDMFWGGEFQSLAYLWEAHTHRYWFLAVEGR